MAAGKERGWREVGGAVEEGAAVGVLIAIAIVRVDGGFGGDGGDGLIDRATIAILSTPYLQRPGA